MTQNTSYDAFTLWKDMYNKTEHAWRDVIEDTLGKEYFAEGLGQIQSQYLQYQELANKITDSYLKQANIPSREELSNVASIIINVESKIDEIEDLIDENKQSTSKEIEQLKKSVTNLDKKLDLILELLNKKATTPSPNTATTATRTTSTTPIAKK